MLKQKAYGTLTIGESTFSFEIKTPRLMYDSSSRMLLIKSQEYLESRIEISVKGEDVGNIEEFVGNILINESQKNG